MIMLFFTMDPPDSAEVMQVGTKSISTSTGHAHVKSPLAGTGMFVTGQAALDPIQDFTEMLLQGPKAPTP